jgi:lipopolysaccharide biosynthesis regulator YciM
VLIDKYQQEIGVDLYRYNVIQDLVDAPTVDAVLVKHGKWIHEVRYTIDSLHSYQQYRCSECGMTYITNTKYCPNCGARMDEE